MDTPDIQSRYNWHTKFKQDTWCSGLGMSNVCPIWEKQEYVRKIKETWVVSLNNQTKTSSQFKLGTVIRVPKVDSLHNVKWMIVLLQALNGYMFSYGYLNSSGKCLCVICLSCGVISNTTMSYIYDLLFVYI